MKGLKNIQAANFNCVFGSEKKAMIEYFCEIVFPAFLTGKKEYNNSIRKKLFFKDVKIFNTNLGYCLYGKIIKDIDLIIKNRLDKEENLIDVNDNVSSAPYSEFIIILKNHRMIFTPSQQGSPTLFDFKTLTKHSISSIIRIKDIKEENRRMQFELDVLEIPEEVALKKKLEKVTKIDFFKFEIKAQNSRLFDDKFLIKLEEERKNIGAKTIEQKITKPSCIEKIKRMVLGLKDMAHYSIKVKEENNEWITIKNSSYKKEIQYYFPEENTNDQNVEIAINKVANEDDRLSEFDKDNTFLYEREEKNIKKLQ